MKDLNNHNKLTTASGTPYAQNEDSKSVGSRGPLLLEDFILHEKMAHFNRERIPERVVHAKGSAAFGTFTVTHDITKYTKAKIFSEVGKKTDMLLRFSTVGGEKGSADTERDPRGFALKFYTEDGNWDLVGNNTPVFFIKDPKKFSHFIHSQKRDPKTNCKNPTAMWDFFGLNPETMHQLIILMSDRGTPLSYRHMHGFGSHTFSLINRKNERMWAKFHFKTLQGISNFTDSEAQNMRGTDPDQALRDLVDSIEKGDFPKWLMSIQVMTEEEAKTFDFNPFDVTKIWSHKEYPLIEVGIMELNQIPENYFRDVEQVAFAPAHLIDGIGYSPDKMLQGRILSYPDAQRYRLGANYEEIPVNKCPYSTTNYQRDGSMQMSDNGGAEANYNPNSFDEVVIDNTYKEPAYELDSKTADWFDRNENDNNHFAQPRILYLDVMDDTDRHNLVNNIANSMLQISGEKKEEIIIRQMKNFYILDIQLGIAIATALKIPLSDKITNNSKQE